MLTVHNVPTEGTPPPARGEGQLVLATDRVPGNTPACAGRRLSDLGFYRTAGNNKPSKSRNSICVTLCKRST